MHSHATTRCRGFVASRLMSVGCTVLVLFAPATTVVLPAPVRAQRGPTRPSPAARVDGRTFAPDSFWVRKWIRGGADEEDLFVEPRKLTATDSTLAVLDLGTREIHLLSTVDGTTTRVMKASGSGPGEFKQPILVVRDRDFLGVLDNGTARMTMFTKRGALVWDAPVRNVGITESACVLSAARVLFKGQGRYNALMLIDSSGAVLRVFSLPDTSGDPRDTFSATAALAGPSPGDRCAIAPLFGARWYTTDALGGLATHRYIEPGAEPTVKVDSKLVEGTRKNGILQVVEKSNVDPIARSAHQIGDTLIVAAGATKRDPLRLLDYYLISTGRYLYSRRLPSVLTALSVGTDGTFYAASIDAEVSWVVAFTPSPTPPLPVVKRGPR